MKELSLKEQQGVLLDIAKAFDKICKKHRIPYYMLGGTMLGAIRHKGFIPWDDDMDFGVPREYYSQLLLLLDNELPYPYRCRTIENSCNVTYPYFKIEDVRTYSKSNQDIGGDDDKLGLFLDIFPLDKCQTNDPKIRKIISLNDKYGRLFSSSSTSSSLKAFVKSVARFFFPFSQRQCYNFINKKILSIQKGEYLANIFGHWEEKEIVPLKWYGNDVYYRFEDYEFQGLEYYDNYLKQLYGNYMQLPPEDKRIPHAGGGVYFKD